MMIMIIEIKKGRDESRLLGRKRRQESVSQRKGKLIMRSKNTINDESNDRKKKVDNEEEKRSSKKMLIKELEG